MSYYNECFNKIISHIQGSNNNVISSYDQLQYTTNSCTVIFGLHSFRCSIVNNIDNTAIVISPVQVKTSAGDVLHEKGVTFHIFNEEVFTKDYDTLYVDSGELFQMSTVHSCSFELNSDIFIRLMEIVTNLISSNIRHNTTLTVQAGVNITEALKQYEE